MDTVEKYFGDNPRATKREIIPVVDRKAPVHQDLTRMTLDCGTKGSPCEALIAVNIDPSDVMHGIRWNDFPAFTSLRIPLAVLSEFCESQTKMTCLVISLCWVLHGCIQENFVITLIGR